eukprot:1506422-Rhodomonas_salina.1
MRQHRRSEQSSSTTLNSSRCSLALRTVRRSALAEQTASSTQHAGREADHNSGRNLRLAGRRRGPRVEGGGERGVLCAHSVQ